METTNLLSVLGLLALAVVVVIVLLRFMRARPVAGRMPTTPESEDHPTLTKEQQDYLDSSHILPPGHDALDTRAEAWRKNQRK